MTIDKKAWGKELQGARTFANLSREDLAKRMGVSASGVANWETGNSGISGGLYTKLLKVFPEAKKLSKPVIRRKTGGKSGPKKKKTEAKKVAVVREKTGPKKKPFKGRPHMMFLRAALAALRDPLVASHVHILLDLAVAQKMSVEELRDLLKE